MMVHFLWYQCQMDHLSFSLLCYSFKHVLFLLLQLLPFLRSIFFSFRLSLTQRFFGQQSYQEWHLLVRRPHYGPFDSTFASNYAIITHVMGYKEVFQAMLLVIVVIILLRHLLLSFHYLILLLSYPWLPFLRYLIRS
jgi:hypothetical protein